MQIMAYNSDLYSGFEQASKRPNGLAVISVLFQVIFYFSGSGFNSRMIELVWWSEQHRHTLMPIFHFVDFKQYNWI